MFASLNILAPTSALCIVINAILAKVYFNEELTCYGYLGSIFIMIGCVLSIIFGTHGQDELTVDDLFSKANSYKFVLFTSIHACFCIVFGVIGSIYLKQKSLTFTGLSLQEGPAEINMTDININNNKTPSRHGMHAEDFINANDSERECINTEDNQDNSSNSSMPHPFDEQNENER